MLVGCKASTGSSQAKTPPPAPIDPWVLTTLDGAGGEPAYLSNGLIGVRVGRSAGGLDPDGKPLGFFMIDEYEPSGEEKIRPMPNPLLVTVAIGNEPYREGGETVKTGGTPLDPRGGTDYRQALDMRTGVLTTSWTQDATAVRCETVVHPTERALGQRWTVTVPKATTYAFRTLDYGGPNDPQAAVAGDQEAGVALTASPRRMVSYGWQVTGGTPGALVAEKGFRVQGRLAQGRRDRDLRAHALVRHAGHEAPAGRPLAALRQGAGGGDAATVGLRQIQADAAVWWKRRWQSDIEIDGPAEDQQAVRSFLFYCALPSRRARGGRSRRWRSRRTCTTATSSGTRTSGCFRR